MFEVVKIINNNTILVNKNNEDFILLGKGIGFTCKNKKYLKTLPDFAKIFTPRETNPNKDYKILLDEIDKNILEATSEIVLLAEDAFGEINPSLFIILVGHIDFAMRRMKQNIVIEHPLIFEIEVLYSKEFSVAKQAVKILENKLGMKISSDEAGYIALHLNAAIVNSDVKSALRRTNILKLLIDEVEAYFKVKISRDFIYLNFVDYFRVLLYRLENGIIMKSPIISTVMYSFREHFQVAKRLATIIENHTDLILSNDEISYMAIVIYETVETTKQIK